MKANMRIVIDQKATELVNEVSAALVAADVVEFGDVIEEVFAGGLAVTTSVDKRTIRSSLRPFAELLLREVLHIAQEKGSTRETKIRLMRLAVKRAGYGEPDDIGENLND